MKIIMGFIFMLVSLNMFSQSVGNVGIGTNTPARPLHITGSGELLRIQGSFPWIGFMNNTDPTYGGFLYYPDTSLVLGSRSGTNLPLIIAPNNTGLLYATAAQRIGIGSPSPTEKLDVNGNINVTGTIKANAVQGQPNQVLGTNASGNLAWIEMTSTSNVGYGAWGDCSMANIGEYNPVVDTSSSLSDKFGYFVSVSGNHSVIGTSTNSVGSNTQQGEVFFYQHNGNNWILTQKVSDATGAAHDYFGRVSMSGNYTIVGAYGDDIGANVDQGSASIYQFNGTNWVLMQKITDATGAANDYFGASVSVSGNRAIIGAFTDDIGANADQGSASIYQFNGTNWVLMQKITDATGAAGDRFGLGVSISGNYAIVGANEDDIGANIDQGSASIYQYNGSSWVLMGKIVDTYDGMAGARFGISVSISGNFAVVGSPWVDTSVGKATIFYNYGGGWYFYQNIYNSNPQNGEEMGLSVSLSGNYLIVGEGNDNVTPGSYEGSATIYTRIGNIWQKYQYIYDPGGEQGDLFGAAVSIDGISKRFVIGAPFAGPAVGKAIFGKIN